MGKSLVSCFLTHDVRTYTSIIFTKFLLHVTYGRGSLLLCQFRNTLCSTTFMDRCRVCTQWPGIDDMKQSCTQSDSTGGSTDLIFRRLFRLTKRR